ncbi:MAG: PfkB family carbohydrate kinase [Nitrososphaerota archaeon]|nr:PfkB family carbohydrate kinase [Candidatus Bathyarchaeota archaeon]MDW8023076.1 PfkB family carbohydrate kinase [Nitrososphaerota archaeon]
MFEIVSAGHFCIDSITLPGRSTPYVILGGSVTYVSLAAKRLGANVSVVSKVGGDFPKAYMWWLSQEGIDLSGVVEVKDAKTTRFELKYDGTLSSRSLRLISRAMPITVEDLPNSLRAKTIHLAPIANEIQYEVAESLKKRAEVLSIDPQGLVRTFDESGNVTISPLADKRILELVNIYKSSLDEIEAVTGRRDLKSAVNAVHDFGVGTVIVTLGVKGAVLSIDGTIYNVPAYKPSKVVDPTGAGDVFIGGFLAEYIRGGDSFWCACVGSAVASTVVEGFGPTFFGEEGEIRRRARVLYEKGN